AVSLTFAVAIWPTLAWSGTPDGYAYLSPTPGSQRVSPWNNVVIRPGGRVGPSSLAGKDLSVVGSASGVHAGQLSVSSDERSLVFDPDQPFALGERVVVSLTRGVSTSEGGRRPRLAFESFLSTIDPKRQPRLGVDDLFPEDFARVPMDEPTATIEGSSCGSLPAGYPPVNVLTFNQPDPARLFVTPFGFRAPGP